jgi:hypothetical protein
LQPYANNTSWQTQPSPPPQSQSEEPQTLVPFLVTLAKAVVKGYLKSLPITILMGAAIWALHTYLLVRTNEGWNPGTKWWLDCVLALRGRLASGTLFWFFAGTMLSMGFQKLLTGTLGSTLTGLFSAPAFISKSRQEAGPVQALLLVGGAGAAWLFCSFTANPILGLMCAIMILGSVARKNQSVFMTVSRLAYQDFLKATKKTPVRVSIAKLATWMTGLVLGFVTALVVPYPIQPLIGFLVAILLLVLAIALTLGRPQQSAAASLIFFFSIQLLLMATPAFADDQGWAECGGTFGGWLNCGGAPAAILIGVPPAIGFGLGIGFGTIIAGFTGIDPSWIDAGPPPPPPPPPQPPAEIDYTYPDGRQTVLVFDPKYGGYINILTGGLVMPDELGNWGNRQQEIHNGVQDWRTRNQQLEATGQDAMSQELNRIRQDYANRQALLTQIGKMERAVFEGKGGMAGLLKAPGEPGDVMGHLRNLANQINSGGKFDQREFDATSRLVRDHMGGKAIAGSQMPKPQGNWETFKDGFIETTRQLASGTDANGNFSWLSVGGRIGAAVITLGTSEGIIGAKEYVDAGGDSAIKGALYVAGVNGLMTVLGLGAAKAAGGILKGGATIGKALVGEGAEALVNAAKNGSSAAQALVRAGQAAQRAGQALYNGGGKTVIDGLSKIKQVLTKDLRGPRGPSVPGRPPVTDTQIAGRNPTYVRDPRAPVSSNLKGIPGGTQAHISQTAQQTGNKIYVRPSSPGTAKRLGEGCHPKTSNIHNKTLKPFETQLGAPPGSEDLVGHYKPKLPTNFDQLDRAAQERLVNTYQARWKEYLTNNAHIRQNPELLVKNGVIHSAPTGNAYTGDVDIWDVRGGNGGKLGAGSYNDTMDALTGGGPAINHNPHAAWNYGNSSRVPNAPGGVSDFEMNQIIDQKILGGHQFGNPNSSPLLVFNPDGTIEGAYIIGGGIQ